MAASGRQPWDALDREALDREALRGLRPAAWTLALLYLGLGAAHAFLLPRAASRVMVPLTWGEAALLLALLAAWRMRPPQPRHAHPWLLLVGFLALANSAALVVLLDEPKQVTNLFFLLMGGGFLLLRPGSFAVYAAAVCAPLVYEGVYGPPSPDWVHYAFGMLSALALAVLVHVVRSASTLRLERARQQEAEKRGQLRTVLEGAPLVLFAFDKDGRYLVAEGQGLQSVGLTTEMMLGRTVFELFGHNAAVVEGARAALAGTTRHLTLEEKGELFDIELTPRPGGGVVGVATNVTDRRRAEEQKAIAEAKAREAEQLRVLDRLRTTFVNTAAHELNTPLTPIRLQLEVLARAREADRPRALSIVRRNVERLQRIVRDLLTMARLQEGRLAVRPARCDVAALARFTVESFAEAAQLGEVALSAEAAGPVVAWAEAQRVQQVLDNLVANALKFTPAGGRVAVRVQDGEREVLVQVQDSGVGIRQADIAALFQPYAQLPSGRERGGTGLGLHLSKALVDAHGGRIWAESGGPGQGSTFSFTLPKPAA